VQALKNDPAAAVTARPGAITDVKPGTQVGLGLAVGMAGRPAVRNVIAPK